MTNRAKIRMSKTANTMRHGCRNRIALIGSDGAGSRSGGVPAAAPFTFVALIALTVRGCVDRDLVDAAVGDTPLVEDGLVAAVIHHGLQGSLHGLGEFGVLGHDDAV